jgi:putative DNA primase/helicase
MGDDAESFEAQLVTQNESQEWLIRPIAESFYDQVINLTKQGFKQKEIAEKLDINKSNVSRHLKRAHQEGRISPSAPI